MTCSRCSATTLDAAHVKAQCEVREHQEFHTPTSAEPEETMVADEQHSDRLKKAEDRLAGAAGLPVTRVAAKSKKQEEACSMHHSKNIVHGATLGEDSFHADTAAEQQFGVGCGQLRPDAAGCICQSRIRSRSHAGRTERGKSLSGIDSKRPEEALNGGQQRRAIF